MNSKVPDDIVRILTRYIMLVSRLHDYNVLLDLALYKTYKCNLQKKQIQHGTVNLRYNDSICSQRCCH